MEEKTRQCPNLGFLYYSLAKTCQCPLLIWCDQCHQIKTGLNFCKAIVSVKHVDIWMHKFKLTWFIYFVLMLQVKKALRGVKVEVTHRGNVRRKYRISGLTTQPTRELMYKMISNYPLFFIFSYAYILLSLLNILGN